LALVAHAGEQPSLAGADLDLAADLAGERDRRVVVVHALVQALQVERDLRARAGGLDYDADRLAGVIDAAPLSAPLGDADRARLVGRIEGIERLLRHFGHAGSLASLGCAHG